MINTIYLDHEFNFLLLENTQEENSESITKIYLNIETDATTGQRLEISVAGGAVVTESIASDRIVKFELSPEYWADDNTTEITPKNDDITGATITINFPKTFTTSAALNYISDTEFDIQAQNEDFAGGGGSGSGGSGGAAFDFVETIRNIGFRLLDEPSNVNAYFDEAAEEIQIKWTDPADITTLEPVPCEWAGTVIVRKEGSAPLHRWDGDLIIDSTTRDQYASTPLIDNDIDILKTYYYGIFPYHVWLDDADNPIKHYRYTKVVQVSSAVQHLYRGITSLKINGVDYSTVIFSDFSPIVAINSETGVALGDYQGTPNYISSLGTDFRALFNFPFKDLQSDPPSEQYIDNNDKVYFYQEWNGYVSPDTFNRFALLVNTVPKRAIPGISFRAIDIPTGDAKLNSGIILDDIQGVGWIVRVSPYQTNFTFTRIEAVGGENETGRLIYNAFNNV